MAHALFIQVNDTLESMKDRKPTVGLITCVAPNGTKIKVDTGDPDRDLQDAKELIKFIQESSGKTTPSKPNPSKLLSEIIEEYCTEKLREGAWTPKTEQETRTIYSLFVKIVGDLPIDKVGMDTARKYKATLLELPPHLSRYSDKSLEKILSLGKTPMAVNSVNKRLGKVSSLFKWAVKFEYCDKNYFDGLTVTKQTKASEERPPFTNEDLGLLFHADHYRRHKYLKPYYYWLPLIGLYSGMRIEEICQLHLEDIRREGAIWVFDINDNDSKKLKNRASNRLVPIHSKLVELGLLKYKQKLSTKGEQRLFPELTRQRDGYSQTASKWFGRLRKRLGFKPVFHSFRHTVATTLKHKDYSEVLVAELLGHTVSSMTYGRYGKAYSPEKLEDLLNGLDFDSVLTDVKPYME